MEKCILFIANIDESGIQTRHKLFDFRQIDVANGIGNVTGFFLERHKPRILKKRRRHLRSLYVDN